MLGWLLFDTSGAAPLPVHCSWCTPWHEPASPLHPTLILARRFLQRPPLGTSDAEPAAHDEAAVQELRTAIAAGLPCVVQLMVRSGAMTCGGDWGCSAE